jgi:hypothetical protein
VSYVKDHKKHANQWGLLLNVYSMTRQQGVSFTIVGGEQDHFESKSFALAKEKLGKTCPDVFFESLPGGNYFYRTSSPSCSID